jgi:hypothetical protein
MVNENLRQAVNFRFPWAAKAADLPHSPLKIRIEMRRGKMCRFGTICPVMTIYELTRDQAVLSASRYSDSGGVQVVPVRMNSSCADLGRGARAPERTART